MATQKTVSFHTLGCKLNYSETSSIKQQFTDAGHIVVDQSEPSDIFVLNTCSVTDFADRKCRYEIRKVRKLNPSVKVVVIGCYAQLKPKEIAEIEGVNLVLGASEKFNILQHIETLDLPDLVDKVKAKEIESVNSFVHAFSLSDRTRSFLKVQDGCDYKCSFCTIPLARGKSRSDTIENVVSNAKQLGDKGVKEIVLTGVNIGDFGNGTEIIEGLKPKKEGLFIDLITALDKVETIDRFRISSIEPNLCNNEIIDFVAQSKRFMPHFHMPLQSGSNTLLKLMRRRYRRELYEDRVKYIKSKMPHCCIGVDVIVGFPGESEELFMESYNFLNELDISYLHVFTYSERPNTKAIELDGVVPVGVRRERNKMLRILSEKKKNAFYLTNKNEIKPVLFEQTDDNDLWIGFTDNYVKVTLESKENLQNQIVHCQIKQLNQSNQLAVGELANLNLVS